MVKEVEEPKLGDGLPKGKLQDPYYYGELMKWEGMSIMSRWVPWPPLYRVWGQGVDKALGSPD